MTNKPEKNVHAASAELSTINYLKVYFGVGRWTEQEDGSFTLEISNHPMHNLSFSEENAQKMRTALEERKLSISDIIGSTYLDSTPSLQR